MKRLMAAAAVAVMVSAGLAAQEKPDFSGTWVLDEARSDAPMGPGGMGAPGGRPGGMGGRPGGGMPGGGGRMGGGRGPMGGGAMSGPVTIVQTATELKIERQMGPDKVTQLYRLDGSESSNPGMRGSTVKSKTRWEGLALVTDSTQAMSGPMGDMTVEMHEVRTLGSDGSMTVKVTSKTPRGENTRTMVYTKSGS
jgi:hypothetical protein